MKFVAIGRSLTLVNSIRHLIGNGHTLLGVITSTPAPEYADTLEELVRISQDREVLLLKSTDPLAITSFIERLSDKPDIAVSVNHNAILGMEVLEKFSLGVLNAHGGDLPRYRGNACQAWAIINGEKRIALCIHKMTPGELDSGEIIERDFCVFDFHPIHVFLNSNGTEVYEKTRELQQDVQAVDLLTPHRQNVYGTHSGLISLLETSRDGSS